MTINSNTALVLSEVYPPQIGGSGHWLHEIYKRQPAGRTIMLVGETEGSAEFDLQTPLRIHRMDFVTAAWTFMKPSGIIFFWKLLRQTIRLHRQYGFVEIHCGRVMPEGIVGLVTAKLLRLKLVCFIHGEDIEISRYSREHRWMTQVVLNHADRLVCNCEHTRSLLVNSWRCRKSNIRVLNPGTDTNLFKPLEDRGAGRAIRAWQDKKVVLTVSRLNERKGHDKLIEALPKIITKVPNVLYVIVGGGVNAPFGLRLQAKVKELQLEEHVMFMGSCDINTLVHCYQCCDLFVLPNRQIGGNLEGFGIVLLEAQACGSAVIAGKSGGTSETMTPGKTGLLVDCEESDNLVEPISQLLNDDSLRQSMGQAGRQLMLDKFSWSSLTDRATSAVFINETTTLTTKS